MTHYRLRENDPSAIILAQNPQSGSYEEAKIYSGSQSKEIYLNDKQNFGIKFFNPLQEKIGARISFNGQISSHLLVINPGQDVTLERFLGESRKMVFETYSVDGGNQKAMEAIQNNGTVRVEFFKEKLQPQVFFSTSNTFNSTFGNGRRRCKSSTGDNYLSRGIETSVTQDSFDFCDYSSNVNLTSYSNINEPKELETGRIEKGEVSNQSLEQVNLEFESYPFVTVEYKLLPISQINRESKEIRLYCTTCGYRIRKESYRFCPKCGEKL